MSVLTTLADWITWLLFRTTVNTNFSTLNTDKQENSVEKTTSFTAANDWVYIATATLTVTDPTWVQGKWFTVIVRWWTATVWWTWYSTSGTMIKRIYSSWVWVNYTYATTATSIVWISSTMAEFDTACSNWNFLYSGQALWTPSSWTLSSCTVDWTNAIWFKEIPQNSKSAAYTLVLGDSWKHIYHPSADTTARIWTIPANASVAYPIWAALTFVNDTSAWVITIAINSDTIVLAGAGSTWSRSLAANWVATAIKVTSTRWLISWTNLT